MTYGVVSTRMLSFVFIFMSKNEFVKCHVEIEWFKKYEMEENEKENITILRYAIEMKMPNEFETPFSLLFFFRMPIK